MKSFSECSKAVKITTAVLGLVAVFAGLLAGGISSTVWALDTRYVTVGSLEQAFAKKEIRDLKRMIRTLEYKKQQGTITNQERWELQGLYDELAALE